jgi:hypothetical protein
MKTFHEYLVTESFTKMNNGLSHKGEASFVIGYLNDSKGFALQFLPDSETKEKYTTDELIKIIKHSVFDNLPYLQRDFFKDEPNGDAAGIIFRLQPFDFVNYIKKITK